MVSTRPMPSLWACRAGPWLAVATIFIDSNPQLQYTPSTIVSNWRKLYFSMWARERRGEEDIYVGQGEEGRDIIKQWEAKKK
jgi:hypothetical protein